MSAGVRLKEAILNLLIPEQELSGIYDGPPPRASYPYVVVDCGTELDWSHKNGTGRQVMLGLTVWDDQPARLERVADKVEAAMQAPLKVSGWQLVTLGSLRRRTVRDVSGPWAAAMDYRARLLMEHEGD